jgi:hypothetical protein
MSKLEPRPPLDYSRRNNNFTKLPSSVLVMGVSGLWVLLPRIGWAGGEVASPGQSVGQRHSFPLLRYHRPVDWRLHSSL